MLSYPPNNHKTDSQTIFFIGSAKESCSINQEKVFIYPNGNFSHIVKLKLGENHIDCDIDGDKSTKIIYGINALEPNPVAYARHYNSFPAEIDTEKNILRSILVTEAQIEIPLNTTPSYRLERVSESQYLLDLKDTQMDLDWIYYENTESLIVIGEVVDSRIAILFNKPIKGIGEKWINNSLILDIVFEDLPEIKPVKVKKLKLENLKICIDPGHGGLQCGTQSPKGIKEKDLNLSVAKLLHQEFKKRDIPVVLTRNDDQELSLEDRVKIASKEKSTVFISLHHNALPDGRDPTKESGISVHYYHENSKDFAVEVLNKLTEVTGLKSAGLYRQNLYVLRENRDRISILVELGFLIHPEESEIICSGRFQKQMVTALAGIC